jgi:hypothetical protein
MNEISQSLIPNLPRTIPVRLFTRRQAGNAAEILESRGDAFLGLGVSLSRAGEVQHLAVATPKEILVIAAEVDRSCLLPHDKPFQNLLASNTSSTLVGFEMARLAIHLSRDLKTAVCGIDLSTLCTSNTREPWRPSKLVSIKLCPTAKGFEIDSLWFGNAEKDHREVCLRAWISAWWDASAECFYNN